MAPVVATTTVNRKSVWGDRRMVDATISFDTGDYAAGGVAVTPAQFGLQVIDFILCDLGIETSATPTAQLVRYNPSASKLVVFQSATTGVPFPEKGAEAFGTGASVRVFVIGY
jgi:hypothetical protein